MSDDKGSDSKLYLESKGIYNDDDKQTRSEGKDNDHDSDAKGEYLDDGKVKHEFEYPKVDVTSLIIEPPEGAVDGPLELGISFILDRDVVAGYW